MTHSVNLLLIHLCDSLVCIDTETHPSGRQVGRPLVWFEHCCCVGNQRQVEKRREQRGGRGGEGKEGKGRGGEGRGGEGKVPESGQGVEDRTWDRLKGSVGFCLHKGPQL